MNRLNDVEILLVEDNPLDAEMTIRALRKCNVVNKLFWVKDGVEALNFLRCAGPYEGRVPTGQIKLVLLDLGLPRLNGIDVLREMRDDAHTKAIPVVVMTSSSRERDVLESHRLGVNGYVTKPVQFAAFAQVVSRVGMSWLLVEQVCAP